GLVDYAHDERLRLMEVAAERGGTVAEKPVEILAERFGFLQDNRELMRLEPLFDGPSADAGLSMARQTAERIVEFIPGWRRGEARRLDHERTRMRTTHWTILIAAASCLALGGCKKKAGAAGPGGIPPVQVIAVEARRQTVWETLSSPGTIA